MDGDFGCAAIAPVKDHDSVTRIGHSLRERFHAPKVTPAAGGKRHPRAVIAEDFIIDIDTAYVCQMHGSPPISDQQYSSAGSLFETSVTQSKGVAQSRSRPYTYAHLPSLVGCDLAGVCPIILCQGARSFPSFLASSSFLRLSRVSCNLSTRDGERTREASRRNFCSTSARVMGCLSLPLAWRTFSL